MKISARKKCCRTLEQLQMRELCVSHALQFVTHTANDRSIRHAKQVLHIAAFELCFKLSARVCLCN